MNTIKILKGAAAISAGLMILGGAANADGIKFYEGVNKNGDYAFVVEGYVPSGLAGENINIMVFNPGYEIEENKNNYTGEYLQHQTVALSEKDGYFKAQFPVNLDGINDSGDYVCFVGGSGFEAAQKLEPCYFASIVDRKKAVLNIIDSDSATILTNLRAAEKDLALADEFYKAVDKEKLAAIVLENKALLDAEKPAESAKLIRALALVEAYNEGLRSIVASGTELKFKDIIDFSAADVNGADFYSKGYNEILSQEGKDKVINSLMNNSYKSVEELLAAFSEKVVIFGIKSPKTSGTGHIDELLSKENIEVLKLNVPKYKAITSDAVRSDANSKIKNATFNSLSELEAIIESAAQNAGTSFNKNPGGGGGSASSGGGGMQIIIGDNKVDLSGSVVDTDALNTEIFTDLTGYEWAKDAIFDLYDKGIVSGVGNNQFAPGNNVTREQFIVMIMRAFEIEATETQSDFSDVLAGTYYQKYIATAKKAGIVNGISENVFGVGKNITRQDLAVMVKNAAEVKGITLQGDKEISLKDKEEISDYAKSAVEGLIAAGVINGYSDSTFKPGKSCTRAEAAKIIYELVKGADI